MSNRVIVVGGGVSGLGAAFRLQGCGFDVTVLEASSEVGGKAAALRRDGFTIKPWCGGAPGFVHRVSAAGRGRRRTSKVASGQPKPRRAVCGSGSMAAPGHEVTSARIGTSRGR
jgi:glycine/D-amino acid oxidase-like deaminating enzyme